ncbi:MAG TPA: hypothetical protein VED46_00310 [Alphaproteobacteria bacterium]|nr:hypothetical protein [Alphaproteobacteria bacterium]
MFSGQFLGVLTLGLAVAGLAAVLVEVMMKSPSTLLDLVLDSRQVAMQTPEAKACNRVVIGYADPKEAANAERRAAA